MQATGTRLGALETEPPSFGPNVSYGLFRFSAGPNKRLPIEYLPPPLKALVEGEFPVGVGGRGVEASGVVLQVGVRHAQTRRHADKHSKNEEEILHVGLRFQHAEATSSLDFTPTTGGGALKQILQKQPFALYLALGKRMRCTDAGQNWEHQVRRRARCLYRARACRVGLLL